MYDRERHGRVQRKYNAKNRARLTEATRRWRAAHPESVKASRKRHLDKMREAAFAVYGRACACCGETERAFLTFDHIDGGGHQERARHGSDILRVLARMGYPPTIQVLCANCNMAKFTRGRCPHALSRGEALGSISNVRALPLFQAAGTP